MNNKVLTKDKINESLATSGHRTDLIQRMKSIAYAEKPFRSIAGRIKRTDSEQSQTSVKQTSNSILITANPEYCQTPREKSDSVVTKWKDAPLVSAWPEMGKNSIAEGLGILINARYNGYSLNSITRISQGCYPICGPAAIMFALAKKNIDSLVKIIIELYETGKIGSWSVPKKLREYDANFKVFFGDNNSHDEFDKNYCRVNWMFNASLAQKESNVSSIVPASTKIYNNLTMHTSSDEMRRHINFMLNPQKIQEQSDWSWKGTVKRSVQNILPYLDKWKECLKKSGTVFWLMHAGVLEGKCTWHFKISDLHWVVVLEVVTDEDSVSLLIHTWGEIKRLTLTLKQFRIVGCHSFTVV